jgi:hypothetical protein
MKLAVLAALTGLSAAACSTRPESDPDFQASLATFFNDPSSLAYLGVQSDAEAICGQINAKNGLGAYTGFQPFVFDRKEKKLLLYDNIGLDEKASDEFNAKAQACPNAHAILMAAADRTGAAADALKRDLRGQGYNLQ